jgi:hypothetical protein
MLMKVQLGEIRQHRPEPEMLMKVQLGDLRMRVKLGDLRQHGL